MLLAASCTNNEIKYTRDSGSNNLYTDCQVWGEEEDSLIAIKIQFRTGETFADTRLLQSPEKIQLDGRALRPDSSRLNGAWYELSLPAAGFDGMHGLAYTDGSGQSFVDSFEFHRFSLTDSLPAIIARTDLEIRLQDVVDEDVIKVIITDTSFRAAGIEREDTLRNGALRISRNELRRLHNGPVFLELYREEERPLDHLSPAGGRLYLAYRLRRTLELTD